MENPTKRKPRHVGGAGDYKPVGGAPRLILKRNASLLSELLYPTFMSRKLN